MEKMEDSIPCSVKQGDSEEESKEVVDFDKSLQVHDFQTPNIDLYTSSQLFEVLNF